MDACVGADSICCIIPQPTGFMLIDSLASGQKGAFIRRCGI